MHDVHYFTCIFHARSDCIFYKYCSNGFSIDTEPPIAGQVYVENNVQADKSTIAGHWSHFLDITEYNRYSTHQSGIKEYFYSIGKFIKINA